MKLKYYIMNAGLSLLMALPAFAAQEEMVTIMPRKKNVLEDSSEHLRIGKEYVVTAQLLGSTVSPVSSMGASVGKHFGRNDVVQLEISKGSANLDFFNLNASTAGANYKHFFGNSFYTKLGIDYREISISGLNYFYYQNAGTIGTANTVVGNIAIGNQWQWAYLTMGCDWVGISPPLHVVSTSFDKTGLNTADQKDLDDSWEKLAKVTSMQLLRFYLGASF